MDRHTGDPEEPFTPDDIIRAHQLDQEIEAEYGVRYLTALVDMERQHVFCVVDAPDRDTAQTVHRKAHGMLADKFIEVEPTMITDFLGALAGMDTGELTFGSGVRTILFTDIVGSTALFDELGDDGALAIRREHDAIVRRAIADHGGREVKHTGDGLMASFTSVAGAVACARDVQAAVAEHNAGAERAFHVRIGLNAGEPVAEGSDLFGTAVNVARRVCDLAPADTILASPTVRDLAAGKGFSWESLGPHELKGFDEQVVLYKLVAD